MTELDPVGVSLHLTGVTVLAGDASPADVPDSQLILDGRGVGLQLPGMEAPKFLAWSKVSWWDAVGDPAGAASAARLTFSTGRADYMIAVPQPDVAQLRHSVAEVVVSYSDAASPMDDLVEGDESTGTSPSAATTVAGSQPRARHAAPRGRASSATVPGTDLPDWTRYKPLLAVIGLIVVLSAAGLVLAQSAGWIHIPVLGSNGSGNPGTIFGWHTLLGVPR